MPLDEMWYGNSDGDPFADNAIGAIAALTMREFATDVAANASTADWFQTTSGNLDLTQYALGNANQSEIIWFRGGNSTNYAYEGSALWAAAYDANFTGKEQAYFTYSGDVDSFLYISLNPAIVSVTNIASGTTIQPVVQMGAFFGSGTTYNCGRTSLTDASSDTVDITDTHVLRFDATTTPVVSLGLRFTPPTDSELNPSGNPTIDLSGLSALVVVRPAAS